MHLPYELRIGMRYAFTARSDKFVSFVSLMSAAGIALGVAALIVVLAVMNGFHHELRQRILSVASHLEAVATDPAGFAEWQPVADAYLSSPQIKAAAPNIQKQGLLVAGRQTQGALVRGIVPAAERTVSRLAGYIVAGDLADLQPGNYGVLLGGQLAQRLRLKVGDNVMLLAPQGKITAAGFYPRMRRLRVVGLFESGLHQYDNGMAYMHMQDAQTLYHLRGATSIRLAVEDLLAAPRLRDALAPLRQDAYLYDWTSSHGGLFRALVFEKKVMFIILTLIIAVAAFNIVSALVTMVRGKRGDIGILRAMGATGGGITRIFLCQGVVVGVAGTLVGVLAGVPLAIYAGDIVFYVESALGTDLFPGSVYHLERLPSRPSAADAMVVAAVAFVLSLLAAAVPAWHSGRMLPAEALRYE